MFAPSRSDDNGPRKPAVAGVRPLDRNMSRTHTTPHWSHEVRGTREVSSPFTPTDRDRHDWLMPLDLV